jgi:hypothetical protein
MAKRTVITITLESEPDGQGNENLRIKVTGNEPMPSPEQLLEADRTKRVPMAVIAAYMMITLYREHALKVGARPLTVLEA